MDQQDKIMNRYLILIGFLSLLLTGCAEESTTKEINELNRPKDLIGHDLLKEAAESYEIISVECMDDIKTQFSEINVWEESDSIVLGCKFQIKEELLSGVVFNELKNTGLWYYFLRSSNDSFLVDIYYYSVEDRFWIPSKMVEKSIVINGTYRFALDILNCSSELEKDKDVNQGVYTTYDM
jgi:hypothetical protein